MTRLVFICIFGLFAIACNKTPPEETEKKDQTPVTTKNNLAEKDTEDLDAGVAKADAGEDPYLEHIVLTEETPVNEIVELVKQLQLRVQEIELREREVIHREQMVAGLEEATLQQVEVLWKLKSQVKVLLEKVGEDFKDERKKYEIKQKKEEEKRIEEVKKQEEIRKRKAAELKRVAEEMTEARMQHIVQLAQTIKGMRAAAGASMLASMDEKDAVAVLRQLGARQAAALLGNMPADKAAALAEAMLGPQPISPETIDQATGQPSEVAAGK